MVESSLNTQKKPKTPKQEPRIQIQDYKEAHTQKKKKESTQYRGRQ